MCPLTLTLTDTGGAILAATIQKFIHYMATLQRRLHTVTVRNHSQVWRVGVGQIESLNRQSNCLLNKQIADKLSGPLCLVEGLAWWDWPGALTNYCPSVLDTLGWVI